LLPLVTKAQVDQYLVIHSNILRKWIRLAQADSYHLLLVVSTVGMVEAVQQQVAES